MRRLAQQRADVGQRARQAREEMAKGRSGKVSQDELACALATELWRMGVGNVAMDQTKLSRIERGQQMPTIEELIAYETVTKTPAAYIAFGVGREALAAKVPRSAP